MNLFVIVKELKTGAFVGQGSFSGKDALDQIRSWINVDVKHTINNNRIYTMKMYTSTTQSFDPTTPAHIHNFKVENGIIVNL